MLLDVVHLFQAQVLDDHVRQAPSDHEPFLIIAQLPENIDYGYIILYFHLKIHMGECLDECLELLQLILDILHDLVLVDDGPAGQRVVEVNVYLSADNSGDRSNLVLHAHAHSWNRLFFLEPVYGNDLGLFGITQPKCVLWRDLYHSGVADLFANQIFFVALHQLACSNNYEVRSILGFLAEDSFFCSYVLVSGCNYLPVNHLCIFNSDEIAIFHCHLKLHPNLSETSNPVWGTSMPEPDLYFRIFMPGILGNAFLDSLRDCLLDRLLDSPLGSAPVSQ